MSLQRKAIRQVATYVLRNAGSTLGERVYPNRSTPIQRAELPAAVLYTRSESSRLFNDSPRIFDRVVRLAVEVFCKPLTAGALPDDELDIILDALEHAMLKDTTLGGTAEDVLLSDLEVGFSADGSALQGAARITFDVAYKSEFPEGSPEDLVDFIQAHAEIELEGGESPDMVSDIELEQE